MQLTKTQHDSGKGIFAKSKPVETKEDWKAAKEVAKEMSDWFNDVNGRFKGTFKTAHAVSHCQVAPIEDPWKLFVLDKEFILPEKLSEDSKQTLSNVFFESQVIFNAEILEAPKKIVKEIPQRKVSEEKDGKAEVEIEMVEKEIENTISVPEGCMSFNYRSQKNMNRLYKIKVRYQYLKGGLLGDKVETFEGWVWGLKSHILQHECEHFDGKNIYFD